MTGNENTGSNGIAIGRSLGSEPIDDEVENNAIDKEPSNTKKGVTMRGDLELDDLKTSKDNDVTKDNNITNSTKKEPVITNSTKSNYKVIKNVSDEDVTVFACNLIDNYTNNAVLIKTEIHNPNIKVEIIHNMKLSERNNTTELITSK